MKKVHRDFSNIRSNFESSVQITAMEENRVIEDGIYHDSAKGKIKAISKNAQSSVRSLFIRRSISDLSGQTRGLNRKEELAIAAYDDLSAATVATLKVCQEEINVEKLKNKDLQIELAKIHLDFESTVNSLSENFEKKISLIDNELHARLEEKNSECRVYVFSLKNSEEKIKDLELSLKKEKESVISLQTELNELQLFKHTSLAEMQTVEKCLLVAERRFFFTITFLVILYLIIVIKLIFSHLPTGEKD